MKLSIKFNHGAGTIVKLAKKSFLVQGDVIEIDQDVNNGFYLLEVSSSNQFTVESVSVDDVSIQELLYLSWVDNNGVKIQPRTTVNIGETWVMPLIFPLSAMFSEVKNQIPNDHLGQNLFEKFEIFTPESVELSGDYNSVIKDFFLKDLRFRVIPKQSKTWFDENNLLPYEKSDLPYPREQLLQELSSNRQLLAMNDNLGYKQRIQSQFDTADTWKYQFFLRNENRAPPSNLQHWTQRFLWDQTQWSVLIDFLNSIDCTDIVQGYIAELPPRSWIYPHSDSWSDRWSEHPGVARLYLPLTVNDRVFFKFADFGLVDLSKASWINNRRYTHAVVNDSDETRYILSLALYQK